MPRTSTRRQDSAQERFNRWFARRFASPLQGTTHDRWLAVRRRHDLRPDPGYRGRFALTTLLGLVNSARARGERARFGDAVARAEVPRPVFVLGHYRSGTTHLHNLLAVDRRLCFANYYQCNFPHTFLTTEASGARLGGAFMMSRRPMDRVPLGMGMPAEDELALCSDTFESPHMMWHFARREGAFRRFLSFREASAAERSRFTGSLLHFARKIALKHGGRSPVFKSPLHTARIPLLLEAFPDARFVHIHRDPTVVYQSTRHMQERVVPLFRYQDVDADALDDQILWRLDALYDAYLADRALVPDDRLVDVGYDELTARPAETLRRVYERLDLPPFDPVSADVDEYLGRLGPYRTNRYPAVDPALAGRLSVAWRHVYEALGYSLPA